MSDNTTEMRELLKNEFNEHSSTIMKVIPDTPNWKPYADHIHSMRNDLNNQTAPPNFNEFLKELEENEE